MSSIKTFLKNARQALNEKDDARCISQCQSALEIDSNSYTAYVFLGLAYTNKQDFENAGASYKKAIEIDEGNLLAWQGLSSLHEKNGDLLQYLDDASRIAAIHLEQSDLTKCLSTIQKAVEHARAHGTRKEKSQALRLILPVSPFYSPLQDELPNPAETYVELAKLIEDDEANEISANIAKGRARLGVKLSELTVDVKREVFKKSPLEQIYSEIINWSHEEAARREAEESLLSRVVDKLKVSAHVDKSELFHSAVTIARGTTIVKVPSELAWNITLNWLDRPLCHLDLGMILSYIDLFPNKRTSQTLQLYIHSKLAPFSTEDLSRFEPTPTSSTGNLEKRRIAEDAEVINAATEALDEDTESPILCLQILTQLFWSQRDWTNTIDHAELTLNHMARQTREVAATFNSSRAEIEYWLATALTYHRSPRFHTRAAELYDHAIKNMTPETSWQARTGKGTLLRLGGDFLGAKQIFSEVLRDKPADPAAQLELALCLAAEGGHDGAITILSKLRDSGTELSTSIMALVHYNLARSYSALQGSTKGSYSEYIQSLKYDPNHAPTYTALGVYYADEAHDDRRAAKCFQRALELSSDEFTAAERLATSFADDSDWNLVQIIAERVIHGNEQLRISWPYRAIGFVHLNTGQYAGAISSFQSSLRISSTDIDAWIGLGESYLALGRYQAAEKAFGRAAVLDPNNWFAQYLSSTVLSAIGEHEKACQLLKHLLEQDTDSFSLRTSISLAYMAWADTLLSSGWLSKALDLFQKVIQLCTSTLQLKGFPTSTYHLLGKAARAIAMNYMAIIPSATSESLIEEVLHSDLADQLLPKHEVEASEQIRYSLISIKALLKYLNDQTSDDEQEAAIWYEIGHSFSVATEIVTRGRDEYRRTTTEAFQCAVRLQPSNDLYWSALGTSTTNFDPGFSQHCLIKAISLNGKSATHWTNLGFLYLGSHHLEAANQAFSSAQQLDPAAPSAWLGQAILAQAIGEADHDLFAHALRLGSPSTYPLLAAKFVESCFLLRANQVTLSSDELQTAIWSLTAGSKCPQDAEFGRILKYQRNLLLEHGADEHLSIGNANSLVEELEESYEIDESDETLKQYCDAKSSLARLLLRKNDLEGALETATSVLELEPSDNEQSLRSCKLVVALAQFHLDNHEEAVATLQELFEEMNRDSDILAVLIQVLASTGDSANVSIALELLESQPALASNSLKLLYAALVATAEACSVDQRKRAHCVLSEIFTDGRDSQLLRGRLCVERLLSRGSATASLLSELHLSPESPETWLSLAGVVTHGTDGEAREHLWTMARQATRTGNVDVRTMSRVYLASPDISDRLVGVHLAPEGVY